MTWDFARRTGSDKGKKQGDNNNNQGSGVRGSASEQGEREEAMRQYYHDSQQDASIGHKNYTFIQEDPSQGKDSSSKISSDSKNEYPASRQNKKLWTDASLIQDTNAIASSSSTSMREVQQGYRAIDNVPLTAEEFNAIDFKTITHVVRMIKSRISDPRKSQSEEFKKSPSVQN